MERFVYRGALADAWYDPPKEKNEVSPKNTKALLKNVSKKLEKLRQLRVNASVYDA